MSTKPEKNAGHLSPLSQEPIFKISKRDYLAGLALQGLLTKYALKEPSDQEIITKMSVELADALLVELRRTEI